MVNLFPIYNILKKIVVNFFYNSSEYSSSLKYWPGLVDYVKFASAVEEAMAVGSLERSPLLVPIQYVPSKSCNNNFLNFDERILLSKAMDKLCIVKEHNLEELFMDFDKEKIGTISKEKLLKALSTRKMLHLISSKELDVVHKCFSVERTGLLELDYRDFLRALHLLRENKKRLPF